MKRTEKYFKLVTNTDGAVPEILLYGYIGTVYDWFGEKDEAESNTDIDFVRTLNDLEKRHSRINIRINSPGGNMKHGLGMISSIRRSPAEIHTYIDGIAASMAFDLWVAGNVRHMASNALGMCHSPISGVWGNAKQMRDEADTLDKFAQTTINVMMESTGMTEEEIRERFYDYADHWLTANEAKEFGLIEQIENYEAEEMPAEPEKMSLHGLIKYFAHKGDQASKAFLKELTNIQQRLLAGITPPAPAKTANHKQMTIEDLKKSLADNTLSAEEVQAILAETTKEDKPAEEPKKEQAETQEENIGAAVEKAITPLQAKIDELEAKLKSFGEKPAETPTGVPTDKDTDTEKGGMEAEFKKTMENWMAESQSGGGNPWIGAH